MTASAGGVVRTARSPNAHAFRIGQRLDVRGTALADGTFKAATVKANGRAKTAKVKAVVVRWQKAQKRLLVCRRRLDLRPLAQGDPHALLLSGARATTR